MLGLKHKRGQGENNDIYISLFLHIAFLSLPHRRWIKTKEKAKVVAAVWGTTLIQFHVLLAILHQDDLKKGMNSSYSSYRPGAIYPIIHIVLV